MIDSQFYSVEQNLFDYLFFNQSKQNFSKIFHEDRCLNSLLIEITEKLFDFLQTKHGLLLAHKLMDLISVIFGSLLSFFKSFFEINIDRGCFSFWFWFLLSLDGFISLSDQLTNRFPVLVSAHLFKQCINIWIEWWFRWIKGECHTCELLFSQA